MLLSYYCESKEIKSCRDRPQREKCAARRSRYTRFDVTRVTSRPWLALQAAHSRSQVWRGLKCVCEPPERAEKNLFRCEHPVTTRMFRVYQQHFRNVGLSFLKPCTNEGRSVCVFIFSVFVAILIVGMLSMIDYCLSCVCPSARGAFFFFSCTPVSNFTYWLFRVHIIYYTGKVGRSIKYSVFFFCCCWSPMLTSLVHLAYIFSSWKHSNAATLPHSGYRLIAYLGSYSQF